MNRRPILLLVVTCAALVLFGCKAAPVPTPHPTVTFRIGGGDSLQPLASTIAAAYQKTHPYSQFKLQFTNSQAGINAFAIGAVDLAFVSRAPRPDEMVRRPAGVVEIGQDAIIVIANPSNPITNLSREQVAQIFAGEVINWSQLGKAPPDGDPIEVISREGGSGTRQAFEDILMSGRRVTPAGVIQTGQDQVLAYVTTHAGAIGYVSSSALDPQSQIRAFAIDGVAPSVESVQDRSYPLMRPVYLLTPEEASPDLQDLVDYVQSDSGRALLSESLSVPTPTR